MRRIPPETFDRPWLLLCEGDGDRRFFDRLIKQHNIGSGQFDVHYPTKGDNSTGGRGKFGAWLSTIQMSPTFRANVKAVLIVSDNDDKPAKSIGDVMGGLVATNGFPVPAAERVVARRTGYPDIVILMIPMDEPGNLETLCVRAAYTKWPLEKPLNRYVSATPAANWHVGKQSKMRMQALLAATCETKPDTSLANHWQERDEFHIPLGDPAFTKIIQFLNGFGALLSGALSKGAAGGRSS